MQNVEIKPLQIIVDIIDNIRQITSGVDSNWDMILVVQTVVMMPVKVVDYNTDDISSYNKI